MCKWINPTSELPSNLFVCGSSSGYQHNVESSEPCYGDEEQTCYTHCYHGDYGVYFIQLFSVVQNVEQAESKHSYDVSSKGQKEQEEITVVTPSYAVVHPRAMMVEILHTVITH